MREIKSRQLQLRRARRIRHYILLSFLLLFLCLAGIIYSTMIVHATTKQQPVQNLYKYYTEIRVCRDDTLWDIARSNMGEGYDSIDDYIKEIRELNSITFNKIEYGQRLVIPYYSCELK